jgi:hypothetical protein
VCSNGHERDNTAAFELLEVFVQDHDRTSEGCVSFVNILIDHMKDHVQCSGMSGALGEWSD